MAIQQIDGGSTQPARVASSVRRAGAEREAPKKGVAAGPEDVATTSGAASYLDALVGKAQAAPEVRDEVIAAFRELLGKGLLDTPEASLRAARALIGPT